MSCSITIDARTGLCALQSPFALERGGALEEAVLAYEVDGPESAPLVVALGGISAGRSVARWWPEQIGPGRALDTSRARIVGVDFLGSAGASTGPASSGLGAAFPSVTTLDQARAIARLLDHLGVERARALAGASYGGMVALAFAAAFPERVERLVAISAPHESAAAARAWRHVQRRVLALGARAGDEREGVAVARALAMTTYRCAEDLAARPELTRWLDARGRAFAERVDAAAYRALSESLDGHRVRPEDVRVPAILAGADSDGLVPIAQLRELRDRLGAPAELVEIRSRFGHDAFLKELDAVAAVLRRGLALEEVAS